MIHSFLKKVFLLFLQVTWIRARRRSPPRPRRTSSTRPSGSHPAYRSPCPGTGSSWAVTTTRLLYSPGPPPPSPPSNPYDWVPRAIGKIRGWTGHIRVRTWQITGRTWQIRGRTWQIRGRAWQIRGRAWKIRGRTWQIRGRTWQNRGRTCQIRGQTTRWESWRTRSGGCQIEDSRGWLSDRKDGTTGQIHCCEWRNKGQIVQKWPTAVSARIQSRYL